MPTPAEQMVRAILAQMKVTVDAANAPSSTFHQRVFAYIRIADLQKGLGVYLGAEGTEPSSPQ